MDTGKIIKLVGVLVALIGGVIGGFPYSAVVIALLGAVGGYFVAADDRMRFLVATIALTAVAGSLDSIPAVGPYITAALGSGGLTALFQAGAITAIVLGTVEAVRP
jgi:hypothetical protein